MNLQVSRFILHVDMDAFFASVEQRDNPELRGRPVLVAGTGKRGVVSAASYEARKFGCRSAQPTSVARRLCPQAIIVKGNYHKYREVSQQVFQIFESFTPLVEPLSIDEAFLDVTGSLRLFGTAESIAKTIRARIKATTHVTASIGMAPNKFLAKLASDMNKPDGLTILNESNIGEILPKLPIERMWGVGPKAAEKLHGVGIRTFGDLQNINLELMQKRTGYDLEHWQKLARGEDDREVTPDREAKSIGQEQTFMEDLQDAEDVRVILLEQAEEVARRLRKNNLSARTVQVKIRFGDFETITRRVTMESATNTTNDLWHAGRDLFNTWASAGFRPVRLIGLSATQFDRDGQLELFSTPEKEKQRKVDSAVDQINKKFGKPIVGRKANRAAGDAVESMLPKSRQRYE